MKGSPAGDTYAMNTVQIAAFAVTILTWTLAILWGRQALAALRGMPTLPDLTRLDKTTLASLPAGNGPHVSVVVPACNEEEAIGTTLRSLLGSTGLRTQIIAVDDRSLDRTGAQMDAFATDAVAAEAATGSHTVEVIHIEELPAGWLGKPHALAVGAHRAVAPWLLFIDGDVTFAPSALELAVRTAMSHLVDHLVVIPTLRRESLAEDAMQGTLQAMGCWIVRLWRVRDPKARDYFGVGGFTLIRREAFERMGGMNHLRMEVVEDVALGWMVKHAGYRSMIAIGPGLATIRWIQGAFGIVGLLEKNGFAAFRYRVWFATAAIAVQTLMLVLPLGALLGGPWGIAAGVVTYGAIALTFHANRRMNDVSPWNAVFFAPCLAIVIWGFIRSMALTLMRDGVDWRGTHYPLSELRGSIERASASASTSV